MHGLLQASHGDLSLLTGNWIDCSNTKAPLYDIIKPTSSWTSNFKGETNAFLLKTAQV